MLITFAQVPSAHAMPDMQRMIELTDCSTVDCFAAAMREEAMCEISDQAASWGRVYVFATCQDATVQTDRVRYATLADNPRERNSSVTTTSDAFHESALRHLEQSGFTEKHEPDASPGQRWFASSAKPGLSILVEKSSNEAGAVWHIGLVWTVQE